MRKRRLIIFIFLVLSCTVVALAQQRRNRGGGEYGGYGESWVSDDARNAREVQSHSTGTPLWTNTPGFEKDVWTFARIKRARLSSSTGGGWTVDTPDSDLNLSYRLQQVTSIRTNPDGHFLWLTDDDLADYPFIYMVEPGGLLLSDAEINALRKYLLNGGFLWLDDFWGESEWAVVEAVFKRVFPDRKFVELPLDHPIYHCVFEIKSKGQIPNVRTGIESLYNGGITWERPDAHEVHHRAIFDDKGHMMVFATHNTDNGDGWERESQFVEFFEHFSEPIAYPLGINVIFYMMTH